MEYTTVSIKSNKLLLKPNLRKKVNTQLHPLGLKYWKLVPIDEIVKILEKNGITLLQEDNTKFQGIITGKKGRASIDIAPSDSESNGFYTPYSNSVLAIQWYKMEESGNYEVNLYLS